MKGAKIKSNLVSNEVLASQRNLNNPLLTAPLNASSIQIPRSISPTSTVIPINNFNSSSRRSGPIISTVSPNSNTNNLFTIRNKDQNISNPIFVGFE